MFNPAFPAVRVLATALVCLPVFASWAQADTVELSSGGGLEGAASRKSDFVVVTVDEGLQIAIRATPGGPVKQLISSSQLETYRAKAEEAGSDPELNYQLYLWCQKRGNLPNHRKAYGDFHLERTIAADPDHTLARAALGYLKHDGQWVLGTELMKERGMVKQNDRWELPEAIALKDSSESNDTRSKLWIRDLARHVKSILRNSKPDEAWVAIRSIDDPLVAPAMGLQLMEPSVIKSPVGRDLRMLFIEKLSQFKTATATQTLVKLGLSDADPLIREAALEALQKYEFGSSSAVATYLPLLRSNDNEMVNAAARALSWFPDPELALLYTEALVTEHKTVIQPGPGISTGFGGNESGNSGGMGGISTGGKAQVIMQRKQNPAALALIKTIEPDQNFGYDQQAWREYFAAMKNSYRGDLRRDP
jgi:HEAT repeats